MGKLVEATQIRYYGNVRRRVGDQFVMADSDFVKESEVEVDGKVEKKKEEVEPIGVVVIEDGYDDPVVESEADLKKKMMGKPQKRQAPKKQADDHRQGGSFDIHPESGVQITGQIAPAKPAASSFVADPAPPAKDAKKGSGSGSKDVL